LNIEHGILNIEVKKQETKEGRFGLAPAFRAAISRLPVFLTGFSRLSDFSLFGPIRPGGEIGEAAPASLQYSLFFVQYSIFARLRRLRSRKRKINCDQAARL
jgi:hypothetical protein